MYGDVFQNINGRSYGNRFKILLFLLNKTCTDTHSQDSCGKDNSRTLNLNVVGKKYQIANACSFIKKQQLFLSVHVNDTKMAGKKQKKALIWKKLVKNVDVEEQTSFLDHVYLRCTQRERKPKRENHWTIQQDVRVPYFFCSKEKLPGGDKPRARTSAWSYDMEAHARKCVERYCELANKKMEQLYKVSSPCLDDHQIKKEELENKGELSEVCAHNVLKCLYLARIGRPDILWSVNKTGTICHKMDSSM